MSESTITLDSVVLHQLRLRLREPLITSARTITHREGVLIEARGTDGSVGWGESLPLPGWPGPDPTAGAAALNTWTRGIAGRRLSLVNIADALADLPPRSTVCAGTEAALRDLLAERTGVSMAAQLASTPRPQVAVNALATGATEATVAESVRQAIADGYAVVKLKVGAADLTTDQRRIGAAVTAAADRAVVRLDANGAWSFEDAVELLSVLDPTSIDYVEEPLADPSELARLAQACPVRLAIDETAAALDDIGDAAKVPGADVVVVKPTAMGGFDRLVELDRQLHDSGRSMVVTSFLDGPVGLHTALHLAAALRSAEAAGLGTASLFDDGAGSPGPREWPVIEKGQISLKP